MYVRPVSQPTSKFVRVTSGSVHKIASERPDYAKIVKSSSSPSVDSAQLD